VIPLIAIIDASYEGHEGIQDEVGPDYAVEAVASFAAAQLRLAEADCPIVVVPETLEPEAGRIVLARLKAAGHAFIGLLMVDEAAALPRFEPDSAVTHIAFRPLRAGEFRRHVDSAATARAAILEARAQPTRLLEAIALAARRLELGPVAARLIASELILASRPLEMTFVDPVGLITDAFDAASARQPAEKVLPPTLPSAKSPGRHPRIEGDARALVVALTDLIALAFSTHPAQSPQITVALESSREGDTDGWLITVDDDGPGYGQCIDGPGLLNSFPPTNFELAVAARVIGRHGGTLNLDSNDQGGGRASVWLPEGRS